MYADAVLTVVLKAETDTMPHKGTSVSRCQCHHVRGYIIVSAETQCLKSQCNHQKAVIGENEML